MKLRIEALAVLVLALALIAATAIRGQQSVAANRRIKHNVVDGGTSPGTTGLVAWYDFADATDSDGGTYNLTEGVSPAYNAGPPTTGSSVDGTPDDYWSSTTLDDNFANSDQDWSLVVRWKAYTSISNNDFIMSSNGGRAAVRWTTAAIAGFLGHAAGPKTGIAPALDTWYTVVLVHEAGAVDVTEMSINGSTLTGGSVTSSYAAGTTFIGGSSATVTNNVMFDHMSCWGRKLTQDEITFLYNAGGTITYSDL